MPELPEVETTVRGLQQKTHGRVFVDVWSDWKKTVKKPARFFEFQKQLKGKKIIRVWRRAKNVILELSEGYSLLVHQKMTGHLMVGCWHQEHGRWMPDKSGPLQEKINLFIHLLFVLDNGKMIALSDVRKFAKVELWKTSVLLASKEFASLGPEPLDTSFTLDAFADRLRKKRGKVKQVLMDPSVIAGVGNIYASEALWRAKIHPGRSVHSLTAKEMETLYIAVREVLEKGIAFGGESFSDYRNVDGEKGHFTAHRKAYQREGQPCERCHTPLVRLVIAGRSSFYCPRCQRLKSQGPA